MVIDLVQVLVQVLVLVLVADHDLTVKTPFDPREVITVATAVEEATVIVVVMVAVAIIKEEATVPFCLLFRINWPEMSHIFFEVKKKVIIHNKMYSNNHIINNIIDETAVVDRDFSATCLLNFHPNKTNIPILSPIILPTTTIMKIITKEENNDECPLKMKHVNIINAIKNFYTRLK